MQSGQTELMAKLSVHIHYYSRHVMPLMTRKTLCGGGLDVGCRREWTRGSREAVRAAENQVISSNCLIGRLL